MSLRIRLSLALASVLFVTAESGAATVTVSGQVFSIAGGFNNFWASSTVSPVTSSAASGGTPDSAAAAGRSRFGDLGVSAGAQATALGVAGPFGFATSLVQASSRDLLTVSGMSSGYIGFDVWLVNGRLHLEGLSIPMSTAIEASAGYTLGTSQGAFSFAFGLVGDTVGAVPIPLPPSVHLPNSTSTADVFIGGGGIDWSFAVYSRIFLPFDGPLDLHQDLSGTVRCQSMDPAAPCLGSVNFYDSALIGGATIYDASFNPVPGAILTSESGYDYALPLAEASPVPEPSSLLLVGPPVPTIRETDGLGGLV
jgi:hypothetical protein